CALVKKCDSDAVFCVTTADHVIGREDSFIQTISDCACLATSEDVLITMGIQPVFPSTGFGYIEVGDKWECDLKTRFYSAIRFVEKPDRQTATEYMESGSFFWNSGMFVWSVAALESALLAHTPNLKEMMDRLMPTIGTPGFGEALANEYEQLERISIDYAVMEKADNIVMATGDFEWDDIGSWLAIENHFASDEHGNIKIGDCESIDAHRNIVMSEDGLVTLLGVDNLIVVRANNSVLICPKDRAQDVKQMVRLLAQKPKYRDLL
ncbi:MAG: mannose-1-phosphate guanylyltransferase, partial [Lentisphaerae bacterium]|nr:mannose-1-phosphate guanylyltransferase [Lentisphaerota bacterium]